MIVYVGKLPPGLVSLNGTETNVTCWLMSGAEVGTTGILISVETSIVGVGTPTLKVALHAKRVNKSTLINKAVRFWVKGFIKAKLLDYVLGHRT